MMINQKMEWGLPFSSAEHIFFWEIGPMVQRAGGRGKTSVIDEDWNLRKVFDEI